LTCISKFGTPSKVHPKTTVNELRRTHTLRGAPKLQQPDTPRTESDHSYSRYLRESLATGESLPPVVRPTDIFNVDAETDQVVVPMLADLEDKYERDFYPNTHLNYIGLSGKKCNCIISVLKTPLIESPEVSDVLNLGSTYPALIIDKNGQRTFDIPSFGLPSHEEEKDVGVSIQNFLNERSMKTEFQRINDPDFPTELAKVEKKHPRKIQYFKVAVLYALEGQTDMMEIFKNQPKPNSGFYYFLNSIAEEITLDGWTRYRGDFNPDSKQKSYWTVWHETIEIMFHIAPWMNAEQHRRLIGNDICVLIYYDSPLSSFDPTPLNSLGTVPQVFTVVQPNNNCYRFGSFNRANLKPFLPEAPPRDYIFSISDLKNYLFTKLHNGQAMTWSCPPMNRLFSTPRSGTLEDLAERFLEKSKHEVKKKPTKPKKMDKTTVIVSVVSGRNLVARDSGGTSDPFCVVTAGTSKAKTPIKMKTLNPTWNSELQISLDQTSTSIDVIVYDWDRFSADTYMGECSIPVASIEINKPTWYPLISKTPQIVTGDIQLKFHYKEVKEKRHHGHGTHVV